MLLHPAKASVFFINEVDVAPACRRQGVATALCRKLIGIARDQGCRGIWLATEEDNVAARALYRRLDARDGRNRRLRLGRSDGRVINETRLRYRSEAGAGRERNAPTLSPSTV